MKNKLPPNYFDFNKILIYMNRPHNLVEVREKGLKKSYKYLSAYAHELIHFYLTLGTSYGIYDLLLRSSFLVQTSATAIHVTKDKGNKLKVPFINELKHFPELEYNYNFLVRFNNYIYPPSDITKEHTIKNIEYISVSNERFNFYNFLGKNTPMSSPVFIIHFNVNGERVPHYVPIGLDLIHEGYSRIVQDNILQEITSKTEYLIDYNNRISSGLFFPYYILRHFVLNEFCDSSVNPIIILIAAFYISMMFLKPISTSQSQKEHFWGLNYKTANDVEFVFNLIHPGETFLRALCAMREVLKSNKKPDVIDLLNLTCKEMGIPSVKEMNRNLRNFLHKTAEVCSLVLPNYPFLKYFLEVSIDILEKTEEEEDLAIFLLQPNLNLKYIPSTISDDRIIRTGSIDNEVLIEESSIIEQFLLEKRIFCSPKKFFGSNPRCANDKDCSVDKVDFPYSKCESDFIGILELVIGDVNKLVPT